MVNKKSIFWSKAEHYFKCSLCEEKYPGETCKLVEHLEGECPTIRMYQNEVQISEQKRLAKATPHFRCNQCGLIFAGGATKLKNHLAGGNKDMIRKCAKEHPIVREAAEIALQLKGGQGPQTQFFLEIFFVNINCIGSSRSYITAGPPIHDTTLPWEHEPQPLLGVQLSDDQLAPFVATATGISCPLFYLQILQENCDHIFPFFFLAKFVKYRHEPT